MTQLIQITKLKSNQKNPRKISDENFDRLKRDIESDKEFLNKRPLLVYPDGDDFVVYAGNMRLRACTELGMEEIPCIVDMDLVNKDGTINEKLLTSRTFRDNETYGNYDLDLIIDNYDIEELKELDLPSLGDLLDMDSSGGSEGGEVTGMESQSVIKLEYDHSTYLKVLELVNELKEQYVVETDEELFLQLIKYHDRF